MKEEKKSVLQMPEELIIDMNENLPGRLTIQDIQTIMRGRNIKVPFYVTNEMRISDVSDMDISPRAVNALKRGGFNTVGDILERIDGQDDLKKLRSCGAKTIAEIMGRLFFYQYSLIAKDRRKAYMQRVLSLNGIQ